jgi:hypothetical protein
MYEFRASLLRPRFFSWLLALLVVFAAGVHVASAATTIRILRGAVQETVYGSAFPDPLVVWVTDPVSERAVPGIQVNFTARDGIGLSSSYAITDEYGLAAVAAIGLATGNSEVSAEVLGVPATRVTFSNLVVDKAPLTVVPGDLKSVVGGPIPVPTNYTFKGFVNGDTEETAQIAGTPILTTTAKERCPHANYAIKGGIGTLSAPNYTFVPGFGTLAVLDSPDYGEQVDQQVALIAPPTTDSTVSVQPAFVGQLESLTMAQPNFIAGLRGESGVFVRAAIWSNPATASASMRGLLARAAIQNVPLAATTNQPTFAAGIPIPSSDAVRSVTLPKLTLGAAIAKTASTRSAIAAVVSNSAKRNDAPVRVAISPTLSTPAAPAQHSYAGSSIRKAFNPRGNE